MLRQKDKYETWLTILREPVRKKPSKRYGDSVSRLRTAYVSFQSMPGDMLVFHVPIIPTTPPCPRMNPNLKNCTLQLAASSPWLWLWFRNANHQDAQHVQTRRYKHASKGSQLRRTANWSRQSAWSRFGLIVLGVFVPLIVYQRRKGMPA